MKMLLIIACLEQSKLRSNYKKKKKKEKENEKTSYFKNRARHVYSILYENKYKTFLKNDDNEAKTWYYNYTR